MNLPQDQLKAFFEVSKARSFTKAAQQLGLTQSALSQRIKNLEIYLETSLFVRATDGIRLTEAGEKLLKYTRVQDQIETEFISDLKATPAQGLGGSLKIAGASTLMWPIVIPVLSSLIRANPNVQIEMQEGELSELPGLLHSGVVDIIVTCGKMNLHLYEEIFLGYEVNVMVESKKHDEIPDVYLDHHPEDRTTIEYLKLHEAKAQKLSRAFYGNINGIITAVEAGLGRAVIPEHMLAAQKSLRVVRGERRLKVPVYVCFLKQPFYSKLHSKALSLINEGVPAFLE